ncbi:MAG: dihydrofolate reductase family protein [Nocardioides sp.]
MIIASITSSLDGYITGPDDGPHAGLGVGGERLHYWVFGGPWTYDAERDTEGMSGADKDFYQGLVATIGAGIVGRGMYDAADAWGGTNPWGGTAFVVTHRVEDQPAESSGFRFVSGVEQAVAQAREVAGDQDVSIGGGASVIRQALDAGLVDELAISTAPVVLGAGKRLWEGFTRDLDLEIRDVHHSPYAVHTRYAVKR